MAEEAKYRFLKDVAEANVNKDVSKMPIGKIVEFRDFTIKKGEIRTGFMSPNGYIYFFKRPVSPKSGEGGAILKVALPKSEIGKTIEKIKEIQNTTNQTGGTIVEPTKDQPTTESTKKKIPTWGWVAISVVVLTAGYFVLKGLKK